MPGPAKVAIFSPHPLLTVTVERRGADGDDVHLHPGGQGVWVARMAAEVGAETILCGFVGGEIGAVLEPLLDRLPGERRLVATAATSGCLVFDRRDGERRAVANAWSDAPSRHEVDDLVSGTVAAALEADALVLCNPYPGEAIALDVYSSLAADVGANGTPVFADLSSPRLDSALEGRPELVKMNDWELAGYLEAPVDSHERLLTGAQRLIEAGAHAAIITRGAEPALALRDGEARWVVPPPFERGSREGCGDSMMGALSASLASGGDWERSLTVGAAAGAANFLRHGLGTGDRETVAELAEEVRIEPF